MKAALRGASDVHARTLADGLKSFENLNLVCVIRTLYSRYLFLVNGIEMNLYIRCIKLIVPKIILCSSFLCSDFFVFVHQYRSSSMLKFIRRKIAGIRVCHPLMNEKSHIYTYPLFYHVIRFLIKKSCCEALTPD